MLLLRILGSLALLFFVYVFIGAMTVRLHYALAKIRPNWTFLSWVHEGWGTTFPNEIYLALWPIYYVNLMCWSFGGFIRAVVRITGVSNLRYYNENQDTVKK